jgi:hypothetical protein
MPSYLVETYLRRGDAAARATLASCARLAAEELARAGRPVRFGGTIHLTEDEICFFVFHAGSSGDAALAAERGTLASLRVVEAVVSREEQA